MQQNQTQSRKLIGIKSHLVLILMIRIISEILFTLHCHLKFEILLTKVVIFTYKWVWFVNVKQSQAFIIIVFTLTMLMIIIDL